MFCVREKKTKVEAGAAEREREVLGVGTRTTEFQYAFSLWLLYSDTSGNGAVAI